MSSSSTQPPTSDPHDTDIPMMEVPDSPPEMTQNASSSPNAPLTGAGQGAAANRANGETKINHGAPGSSWNTKKFTDEWERANSALLDRDFDPTRYGDPFV